MLIVNILLCIFHRTNEYIQQYFICSDSSYSEEERKAVYDNMCVIYRYLMQKGVIVLGQTMAVPHVGCTSRGVVIAHFPPSGQLKNGLYVMPSGDLMNATMNQLRIWLKLTAYQFLDYICVFDVFPFHRRWDDNSFRQ